MHFTGASLLDVFATSARINNDWCKISQSTLCVIYNESIQDPELSMIFMVALYLSLMLC